MPDCHPSPPPTNDVAGGGSTCTGFSHYLDFVFQPLLSLWQRARHLPT